MKVSELIELLQKMPQDVNVYIKRSDDDDPEPVIEHWAGKYFVYL